MKIHEETGVFSILTSSSYVRLSFSGFSNLAGDIIRSYDYLIL